MMKESHDGYVIVDKDGNAYREDEVSIKVYDTYQEAYYRRPKGVVPYHVAKLFYAMADSKGDGHGEEQHG